MSRHKLVKNMDLDDELDDFDGGDDYDGGAAELTSEEKEQLQRGTVKVREVIGPEATITDKEIQDSLWHYYYDVDKTVNYVLSQHTASEAKTIKSAPKKAKENEAPSTGRLSQPLCETTGLPFPSMKDFFYDSPWLNVPVHRRGEIRVEPLYLQAGLLGGSTGAAPRMSKLQALAAARKKAREQLKDDPNTTISPVTLLDKLSLASKAGNVGEARLGESEPRDTEATARTSKRVSDTPVQRKYPTRKPKSPAPPLPEPEPKPEPAPIRYQEPLEEAPVLSAPSLFAQTIFRPSRSYIRRLSNEIPIFTAYQMPDTVKEGQGKKLKPFAGPSPDDVAAQAQSGSKGIKAAAAKKPSKAEAKKDGGTDLSDGVSKIAITDTPRVKSKNLDVAAEHAKAEKKNAANFVVIGHVDAGKSTLMGRLLLDLSVVSQRDLSRYQKEASSIGKSSFALAWFLDQGAEERARGVTIDIAQNTFATDSTIFTILDAPGHRDFIPNMIAGASQADFAVLVIDAGIGGFEAGLRGQTKEHALLARSIGVQRLVVAVNKLDSVVWAHSRFEEIEQQLGAFLAAAGFQAKNIIFVPCSGLSGDNVTKPSQAKEASWYEGPILLEALEKSTSRGERAIAGSFRLSIADIFRGGVQNPLSVAGRIEQGSLQVGDALLVVPTNNTCYIKGIEVNQELADYAVAGQNVVLHLSDIDPAHLRTGDVLCSTTDPLKCLMEFTVKALAFEHLMPMHVDVHRGRLHKPARVAEMTALLDKGSGSVLKKKPRLVKPGQVARIKVMVEGEEGLPIEKGSRVVLRAGGETVAAGLVE